jgi:hypothetical protein
LIKAKVKWVKHPARVVNGLKSTVRNRISRQVTRKELRPLVKSTRNAAPKRTGGLRKSIGSKVKTYRNNDVTVGIVGSRMRWKKEYGTYTRGKNKNFTRLYRPARIIHIVEKKRHFIATTLAVQGDNTVKRIQYGIGEGITQYLNK